MLFKTKQVVMTNGIATAIDDKELSTFDLVSCIDRHFNNDGEECKQDKRLNAQAIKHLDGRVVSVFTLRGSQKIYIITDGLHLTNCEEEMYKEYPLTTILFADEY